MVRLNALVAVVAVLLLLAGGITCGCAGWLFHRGTVLENPIRFKEGSSFRRTFTVDIAAEYWLILAFNKDTKLDIHAAVPRDDFTAEYG
jgi:hypothetical protein